MKNLINNRYANLYLNAADVLGLKYTVLNERAALIQIYNKLTTLEITANFPGLNSQLSAALATNKMKTSVLLSEEKIPVPAFRTFTDKKLAEKYLLEKVKDSHSLVVKPLSSSLSVGITVNPTTPNETLEAIREAFDGNSEIIIEKYVTGKHYRVTVLDDEVIAITQRYPAYVIGDAVKTIKELIKEKNTKRKLRALPPILLRNKDLNYLRTQKVDLMNIYPHGEFIQLQLGCDLDIGGERVRIDRDSIPVVNTELFIRAAKTLRLRFAGIDYISPDISKSYKNVTSAINEINSAPDLDVHFQDTYPNDNYAAIRVIEKVFREKISTISKQPPVFLPRAAA